MSFPATTMAVFLLGSLYMVQVFLVSLMRVITSKVRIGPADEARTVVAEEMEKKPSLWGFLYPAIYWVSGKLWGDPHQARDNAYDTQLMLRFQRAQENAAEYLPLFLILVVVAEMNGAVTVECDDLRWRIWVFFGARIAHAVGLCVMSEQLSIPRAYGWFVSWVMIVALLFSPWVLGSVGW